MSYLSNRKSEKEIFEVKTELLKRINEQIFATSIEPDHDDVVGLYLALSRVQELVFASDEILEAECDCKFKTAVATLEAYEREVE